MIKDLAIGLIESKLKTVKRVVETGLRQWGQPVNTQEEVDSMEQAIAYLKGEETETNLINGFAVKVLESHRYHFGQKLLISKAAQSFADVKELARKTVMEMDEAISLLTIK